MSPTIFFHLIIHFFFNSLFAKVIEHYLTQQTNDTNIVAKSDAEFLDLVCPQSHSLWFVPRSSFALQLLNDNRLRIGLGVEKRVLQRGFYACCPRELNFQSNAIIHQVQTPDCCPCCPWPEEEYCEQRFWNNSEVTKAPLCLQIFLFTGVVPHKKTTLLLPWRSKVLIPCPAPLPDSKLFIYSQLPKIKPSRRLWFDVSMTNIGDFDPRFGVCTTQKHVPGGHMQLSCEYSTSKSLIKLQAPFAPPTFLPNVTCKLQPIGKEFATNLQSVPEFRVLGPRNLTVTCTALYSNIIIAKKPPTLCFRWLRTTESPGYSSSGWSRHECIQTEQIENTVIVAATNSYGFVADGSSTNITVEIVERNRATEAQYFTLCFRVFPLSMDNQMFVEVANPVNTSAYSLFSNNLTGDQTLILLDTSLNHLTLGFYAIDEVSPNNFCSSPTHPADYFALKRSTNKWLCDVTLPASAFDIVLQLGDLVTVVTVHPSPNDFIPRSTLTGLQGSVDVYINVSCPLIGSERPTLLNTTVSHVRWLVYRSEDLVCETYTNTSWLLIAPLVNSSGINVEPVLELSSPPLFSPKEFLANLSNLNLPPVVDFPRRLCVSCETFFYFGGSSKSGRECVTLEAKEEPKEENLSIVQVASRRFSSDFTPIQVSNVSNPSFRITTAFPSGDLKLNGSIPLLSVYEGSILEMRCSMSRSSNSSVWPLILFYSYNGDESFPDGILKFYALPFALESRLRINTTMMKTSDIGIYACLTTKTDPVYLFADIVASKLPEIVEPNQPVRYFAANEIIRLTCRAVGGPGPVIIWRLVNGTHEGNTTLLKWCNELLLKEEEGSCSLMYVPPPFAENVTIQCEATNYLGTAIYTLNMIRIGTGNALAGNVLFNRLWKNYMFWIVVPLTVIVFFLLCLGTCLWRKSRQIVKAGKLIKMDNLIYGQPEKLSGEVRALEPFYKELLFSLMPTEELRNRWCLDRRNLKPFSQPLGNGHYGTVQKGIYYGTREKDKKCSDAFFVALKSPSTEMASLSCFHNEIAHLMKLSDGPNIVKMIGCAFGERGDLRDTLLVLEFCPNTSLSDFIRRMLYPRGCYDNRPMYVRNAQGEITSGGMQVSTTPFSSSGNPVSQLCWGTCNTPVRVFRNDYEDMDVTPKSEGKRRRQGGTARRNTALVYQRLTRNSSSIFLQIATGISKGLEFLALNNVIHRDLATRNILMDAKYEPKICDFGLAVTVDSSQGSSSGITTQQQQSSAGCYHIVTFTKQLPFRILPPEALSKQLFFLSSDIWEFGLLLWQMFFFETRKPFENIQSSEALLRLLSSTSCRPPNGSSNYVFPEVSGDNIQAPPTIDRPPAIPDSLWKVLRDCLHVQASERPTATEVRRRLEDCYTTYDEIGDSCAATDSQESDCYMFCRRVPSPENTCGDIFEEQPTLRLATYENIEQARNSAGYLESFSVSSL